ncbi:MAG TPA: hypothetical protein VG365_02100, partial [Solirubrobacteraceae bacterium]|nr:hypothetical protein [Solirubrobacteraceae bacterium]
LTRDYLPAAGDLFAPLSAVTSLLPGPPPAVTSIPIPGDCQDGFAHAYWKRPEALLHPGVNGAMAMFANLPPVAVKAGLARLRADIASGHWQRRNRELAELDALDLGHRLVVWRAHTRRDGMGRPTAGQALAPEPVLGPGRAGRVAVNANAGLPPLERWLWLPRH